MRAKLIQGWEPGALDREAMTHPDLVPYNQLPESSKILDRTTATAALPGLDRLGYRVVRKPGSATIDAAKPHVRRRKDTSRHPLEVPSKQRVEGSGT